MKRQQTGAATRYWVRGPTLKSGSGSSQTRRPIPLRTWTAKGADVGSSRVAGYSSASEYVRVMVITAPQACA